MSENNGIIENQREVITRYYVSAIHSSLTSAISLCCNYCPRRHCDHIAAD
jgi:hypothetical protein